MLFSETRLAPILPQSNIHFQWYEDVRPSFEGLAVLNISWEHPNKYEYITSYTIRVLSSVKECGTPIKELEFTNIIKASLHDHLYNIIICTLNVHVFRRNTHLYSCRMWGDEKGIDWNWVHSIPLSRVVCDMYIYIYTICQVIVLRPLFLRISLPTLCIISAFSTKK